MDEQLSEGTDRGEAQGASDVAPRVRKRLRPREETAQRKIDILQAAMKTFGAKGYGRGSLGEIAKDAGMTHAGILHHYGSKQNLLTEVLEYRDRSDVENLAGQTPPKGLELFHHLIRTALLNSQRRSVVRTYAVVSAESITDDHPAQDYFRARFAALRAMIIAALTEALGDEAEDHRDAIPKFASSIIGVMDGIQIQWLLDPETVNLEDTTAWAITAMVRQFFPDWQ